jgi:hypothetical protein
MEVFISIIFNENLNISTVFSKSPQYRCQEDPFGGSCVVIFEKTDIETDMGKLTAKFSQFFVVQITDNGGRRKANIPTYIYKMDFVLIRKKLENNDIERRLYSESKFIINTFTQLVNHPVPSFI